MTRSPTDFVFRGLLARHAIIELRSRGLLRAPASTADELREHDLYAPVPEAIRTSSASMQRTYRMLFVFENLLRDFIAQRLGELDGESWFDTRASAFCRSISVLRNCLSMASCGMRIVLSST